MNQDKIIKKYESLSREEIIDRCEMYRRQIGGLSKRPNVLKSENEKLKSENAQLKQILKNLFQTYVDSHTWVDPEGNVSLSHFELDYIQQFKQILELLNIDVSQIISIQVTSKKS